MSKRHIKKRLAPLNERLAKLGIEKADPEDEDARRALEISEDMDIAAQRTRPAIMTRWSTKAQARSDRAVLPGLEPVRRRLTKLWKEWTELPPGPERRKVRQAIAEAEKEFWWIRDRMPDSARPGGVAYCRVWHGRVYRMDFFGDNILTKYERAMNHLLPSALKCPEAELRDRYLSFVWHFRRSSLLTVSIPVSRGKPKARCVDCGSIHPLDARYDFVTLKPPGCPRCGSKTYKPIDPTLSRPGTEKVARVSLPELARRFHVKLSHLKRTVKKYSLPPELK